MKIVKRILIVLLALIVLIIGAAIAIPYIYKDEIIAMVKEEVNKNVRAEVDFGDVGISLFKNFPKLSISIQDYSVTGIDEFAGKTLAKGASVGLAVDLMSIIKADRPVSIRSVSLEKPDINVYVTKDGLANYDIAIPSDAPVDTTTTSSADYSNLKINLDKYNITDAHILYDDKSMDVFFEATGLTHEGKGNFTIDVYDLDTKTSVDAMTIEQSGVAYLKEAKVLLDAIFNIDQPNSKYTLKDNELTINALKLNADGYVQLAGDDINMDLAFNTPQNDFKSLWSMIPNAYIEGYEDVKADGQFTLDGAVKGTYNGVTESYPSFHAALTVGGANVQYPGLPLGINNINTDVQIKSPSSDFDDLTVDVPRFSMKLGDNPFDASFYLRHPISDPDVRASAKGIIDLADINKAFPVEGIDELSGIINADVDVNTRLSYIEQEAYEKVNMAGEISLKQMVYQGEGLPKVLINSLQAAFTPQSVNIPSFDGHLGQSDIQASASIDNILAYFSPEKTMYGTLEMTSSYFNADEWMTSSETTENTEASGENASYGASSEPVEIFDRFDFALDAKIDKIDYDIYEITKAVAIGHMTPNRLEVSNISAQMGESDFAGNGVITGVFDYLFEDGSLGGDLNISSNNLNLNQFMEGYESTEETASSGGNSGGEETYSTIPVPDNIDMQINARVGNLTYTDINLKNVNGSMSIAEEAILLNDVTADGLGGKLGMSGSYDTKDIEKPAFNFKYDLQSLDFQKAFNTFNTFEQLAPIGKYINGSFTSTMIMNGALGQDMMPLMESLNAEGFLETLNGVIQNFGPTQAIGEKLNINELKRNIDITNTKNWFEIVDGKLELKEYDAAIDDIKMKIGGTYSLASLMDMDIKAQIPRKMLEGNAIGAAASKGLGLLQGQASKLGININQGENVNVLINLTGAITDPKVGIKLLGMDGESEESSLTESVKEEVKDEAKKQFEDAKQQAKDAAEEAAQRTRDSLERLAEEAAKRAREEAERKAKEKLEEVVDSTTQKKIDDALDKVGKDAEDKIKDNLDKWNPFKKKKGGGR